MTPKELLKPRYKTIADFPSNITPIGHITVIGGTSKNVISSKEFFDKYPHLFKKLEWWEDRKPEDMPEYVRYTPIFSEEARCFKVPNWYSYVSGSGDECIGFTGPAGIIGTHAVKPITESEYLQYLESKNKQTKTPTP